MTTCDYTRACGESVLGHFKGGGGHSPRCRWWWRTPAPPWCPCRSRICSSSTRSRSGRPVHRRSTDRQTDRQRISSSVLLGGLERSVVALRGSAPQENTALLCRESAEPTEWRLCNTSGSLAWKFCCARSLAKKPSLPHAAAIHAKRSRAEEVGPCSGISRHRPGAGSWNCPWGGRIWLFSRQRTPISAWWRPCVKDFPSCYIWAHYASRDETLRICGH